VLRKNRRLPRTQGELTTDYPDNADEKMIHEEISGKIISAAMEMLNELKLRLDEKL
jgi:hypothetical protein